MESPKKSPVVSGDEKMRESKRCNAAEEREIKYKGEAPLMF